MILIIDKEWFYSLPIWKQDIIKKVNCRLHLGDPLEGTIDNEPVLLFKDSNFSLEHSFVLSALIKNLDAMPNALEEDLNHQEAFNVLNVTQAQFINDLPDNWQPNSLEN